MRLAMFLFYCRFRHIVLMHYILVIMQCHYNATFRQRIGARAGR
jgi:hypothetical protein